MASWAPQSVVIVLATALAAATACTSAKHGAHGQLIGHLSESPSSSDLSGAFRFALVATVRPDVSDGTVYKWMLNFGRPSTDDEPGMMETNHLGNAFQVLFYANSTPAQREHARETVLHSGLFENIRWTSKRS